MPELAEVEYFRKQWDAGIGGKILRVAIHPKARLFRGIDLPAIIRQSTDSVTAEVMTDVRTQGERGDDLVSGFVARLLGRERDQR